jgi:hypothetical protein
MRYSNTNVRPKTSLTRHGGIDLQANDNPKSMK